MNKLHRYCLINKLCGGDIHIEIGVIQADLNIGEGFGKCRQLIFLPMVFVVVDDVSSRRKGLRDSYCDTASAFIFGAGN